MALNQMRPRQQRRISGRGSAPGHLVAAAGAGMAAVDHELLSAEPGRARFLVDDLGLADHLAQAPRGMDIDLDDAGTGSNAEMEQARSAAGLSRALDEYALDALFAAVLVLSATTAVS